MQVITVYNYIFVLRGVLCTWVKLFSDLQILMGCEMHKNAFGGRLPAGGDIALPQNP